MVKRKWFCSVTIIFYKVICSLEKYIILENNIKHNSFVHTQKLIHSQVRWTSLWIIWHTDKNQERNRTKGLWISWIVLVKIMKSKAYLISLWEENTDPFYEVLLKFHSDYRGNSNKCNYLVVLLLVEAKRQRRRTEMWNNSCSLDVSQIGPACKIIWMRGPEKLFSTAWHKEAEEEIMCVYYYLFDLVYT